MSYVETLAQMLVYAWYGISLCVAYVFISENVWRVRERYDKIKNPVKYDKNLREFRAYMFEPYASVGIQIDNGEDDNIIIGNYCAPANIYTVPPKYEGV